MKAKWIIALWALSASAPALAQETAEGERLFRYWCATCHGVGPGHPGTQALAALYEGADMPDALELREDLDPLAIAYFVRNGSSVMPFLRKTELSDAQLAELSA